MGLSVAALRVPVEIPRALVSAVTAAAVEAAAGASTGSVVGAVSDVEERITFGFDLVSVLDRNACRGRPDIPREPADRLGAFTATGQS